MAGCAGRESASASADPFWQLASAQPIDLRTFAEGRITYDRPLPAHMTQELSDQFALITIRSTKDWQYTWRRLGLSGTLPPLDFADGMVVGLLADVGEFAQKTSPIQIESIQAQAGHAIINANLMMGVYYPIKTANYVQLVYVPGVRTIRLVRINQASFTLRAASSGH